MQDVNARHADMVVTGFVPGTRRFGELLQLTPRFSAGYDS